MFKTKSKKLHEIFKSSFLGQRSKKIYWYLLKKNYTTIKMWELINKKKFCNRLVQKCGFFGTWEMVEKALLELHQQGYITLYLSPNEDYD